MRKRGLRLRLQLRSEIEGIVQRHALLAEWRRRRGNGLRGPRLFALDVARRHRTLLDRPHRRAGNAIEDEREALLRELDDGVDALAVDGDRDEVRRRRGVVVPDAVVRDLEVPLPLAGRRVEAQERLAVEPGALARAAVEVVARRAHRRVQQPSLHVERHRRPDVGVARDARRSFLPRLVPRLAALRDGVEAPHLLAGARMEGADVARRIVLVDQPIADAVAEDDEILVDHGRRGVACSACARSARSGLC